MAFCPKCGKQTSQGTNFCDSCGENLTNQASSTVPKS